VVLAGHSMGGIAISAAAERCPERVRVLVYLAAFLLPDGRTLVDTFAADAASLLRPGIVRGAVRGTSLVTAEAARAGIYSDASAEDAAWATARLGPDPNRPAATPLQLSEARYGAVPRVYIECLRDRAVTLPLQRAMVAASPCRRVISLDCGHSPMFSAPALLAAALEQAAEV
jgi:pimeloyl-ACP methyl ester carboxylesterase